MDAAEPVVAESETDNAGGIPAAPRRKRMGWFARVSLGAGVLTTVLGLVFWLVVMRAVESDSRDGQDRASAPVTVPPTTTATVPSGAVYIVLESTAETASRWDQAAIAHLTEQRLARYGFAGVEAQCVGSVVVVAVPPMAKDRQQTAFELIVSQPGVQVQSSTETPPDTTGNLVGCE